MTTLFLSAPAKLNLYLHVTGKREDGYHLLDSLVAFPQGIEDTITIEKSDRFEFTVQGAYADILAGPDNLVVKAAQAVSQVTGQPLNCRITLHKRIPPGAGLGGGSSDAAATVRGLLSFWKTEVPDNVLWPLLAKLGADVPACYFGEACRFRGIGDVIDFAPAWPPLWVSVVWPGTSSFTKNVFSAFHKPFTPEIALPSSFKNSQEFLGFLKTAENDLTDAALSLSPAIKEAFTALKTVHAPPALTRMSGSGSCVFGLFEEEAQCQRATKEIADQNPSWWVQTGRI